jgi:hypothetical protein
MARIRSKKSGRDAIHYGRVFSFQWMSQNPVKKKASHPVSFGITVRTSREETRNPGDRWRLDGRWDSAVNSVALQRASMPAGKL